MRAYLWGFVCLLALSWAGPARAQSPASLSASIFQVEAAGYPEVRVYFSLQDRARLVPVEDLRASAVQASLPDGQAMSVLSLAASPRPLEVAVLLDLTSSVQADELANQVLALQTLAGFLGPEDRLAVLAMDHAGVQVLGDLNAERTALLAQLGSLTPTSDGGNVFWDGAYQGVQLLAAGNPAARKALVIISDVTEAAGEQSLTSTTTAATAQGIPVYTLYFASEADFMPQTTAPIPPDLNRLGEDTGGIAWSVAGQQRDRQTYTDDEALPNMMRAIATLASSEYELVLQSPLPPSTSPQNFTLLIQYGGLDFRLPTQYTASPSVAPASSPSAAAPTPDFAPPSLAVTLGDLPAKTEAGDSIRIQATIGLPASVQQVRLLVDGQTVATQDLGPFDVVTFDWPAPDDSGTYQLEVQAVDINGQTASQSAQIEVAGESSGGGMLASLALFFCAGLLALGVLALLVWYLRRRGGNLAAMLNDSGPAWGEAGGQFEAAPDPGGRSVPAHLVIATLQSESGQVWSLIEGENTLGRHGSNYHQIRDEAVSRQHAIIEVQALGGQCFYRDTEASHPTEINGRLLAANERYPLQEGDRLRLGSTVLIFHRGGKS